MKVHDSGVIFTCNIFLIGKGGPVEGYLCRGGPLKEGPSWGHPGQGWLPFVEGAPVEGLVEGEPVKSGLVQGAWLMGVNILKHPFLCPMFGAQQSG